MIETIILEEPVARTRFRTAPCLEERAYFGIPSMPAISCLRNQWHEGSLGAPTAGPYSVFLDEFQEMVAIDALDDYLRSFRNFKRNQNSNEKIVKVSVAFGRVLLLYST